MAYIKQVSTLSEMIVPDTTDLSIEQKLNLLNKLNTYTTQVENPEETQNTQKQDSDEKYIEKKIKIKNLVIRKETENMSFLDKLEESEKDPQKKNYVSSFKLEKIDSATLKAYLRKIHICDITMLTEITRLIISKWRINKELFSVLGEFLAFLYLRCPDKYNSLLMTINDELMALKLYKKQDIANRWDAFADVV